MKIYGENLRRGLAWFGYGRADETDQSDRTDRSDQGHLSGGARAGRPAADGNFAGYFTTSSKPSEWLLNSGAYMHWISAIPV